MDPAVAAIVGAAVGGLIPGAAAVGVEARRDKRDRARQDAETRSAARLVWEEISHAETTLTLGLQSEQWGVQRLSTAMWTQHKGILSAVLTINEWMAVKDAALMIEFQEALGHVLNEPVAPDAKPHLEERIEIHRKGRDSLGRHVADP